MSQKLSSYQKLKAENEKLKQDVYYLVKEHDTENGIKVRIKWDLNFKIIDAVYAGVGHVINQATGIIPNY